MPMLAPPAYIFSIAALLVSVGALALGAVRVRSRLLAGWAGMPARLADAVLTLALLVWTAELIGAVGILQRAPLVAACLAVGLGLRLAVKPAPPGVGHPPPAPPGGRFGPWAAALIAAIVLTHWSIGTIAAFRTGMTGYDSAWYHMPFAAHFAQTGSTLDFAFVSPRYLSWFYPQNSELLHGVGLVLFHRDVLSPLLNLIWLVGCLAAAWCIGRPYGAGPWTVAAAAVLLDAGVMADQAGEARNDTLALFFLLAAVAMIVNGAAGKRRLQLGPTAIAGLAAGLAAGTKLSLLAPVAVLLVGVPLIAVAGRRRVTAVAFGAPLLAGCGFWYLRNAVLAGNPLPWLKAVGPLQLDGPEQGLGGRPQFSVLHYFGDGRVWSDWFEPGLSHRLGELWPLVLGVAVLTVVVCLARASRPLKLVALAAAAGVLVYLLDGTSAEGPSGTPVGFASSLRHLAPALCLALVLAPLLPALRSGRARWALAVFFGALLVAADLSGAAWGPGYVAFAAGLCALAVVTAVAPRLSWDRALSRPALSVACVAAGTALLTAGWFAQRSYLDDRYAGHDFRSAGLNAAFEWASVQQNQRIATTLPLEYPLFGTDLSNRVEYLGRRIEDAGFVRASTCASWIHALNSGHFGYLVTTDGLDYVGRDGGAKAGRIPARLVFERKRIQVFRLDEPLDRTICADIGHQLASRSPQGPAAPSRART
jgi:hypothetical protein